MGAVGSVGKVHRASTSQRGEWPDSAVHAATLPLTMARSSGEGGSDTKPPFTSRGALHAPDPSPFLTREMKVYVSSCW